MILWAVEKLASLSRKQILVILATVILPAIVFPFLLSWIPGEFIVRPVIYILWSLIAFLSVASMLHEDKAKAEEDVNRKVNDLSNEVQKMKKNRENTFAGLQNQLDELDRVVRSGFEEIGHPLPPRRISLRGSIEFDALQASGALTVRNRKGMRRLLLWVKRQAYRLKQLIYG